MTDATEAIDSSASPDAVPRDAERRHVGSARLWSGLSLGVIVAAVAIVATRLHRDGHTTGDDFMLYINQARSLFEGDIADVISDNRFLWEHSAGVTPQIYPWGFPILLSPMVRLWGISAFDRMKLLEVACLCAWLVLFHGVVRRRAGRIAALAIVAVFATAHAYLLHTDQLLTEFPHLVATAVFLWWLDRVLLRSSLVATPHRDLVVLGLFIVLAYNVRRESVVLVAVVGAAQLVDVVRRWPGWAGLPWKRLALPHASFAVGAFVFQLLLPSTLVPDNGNSRSYIPKRLFGQYPGVLTKQLGLDAHHRLGVILMALALVGAVVACLRRPRLNVPLAVLAALTMLVLGTHIRMVDRYYFQVTPILVYFVVRLVIDVAELALGDRRLSTAPRRLTLAVLMTPLLWVAAVHVWGLPSRVDAAERFNDSGSVQSGGNTPRNQAAFDAITRYTRDDDIVVFYRVRTMTLYTGRRGVQTGLVDKAQRLADYFMQNLRSNYSQPRATEAQLRARGWEVVWEDGNWRLWRIDREGEAPDEGTPVDVPLIGGRAS